MILGDCLNVMRGMEDNSIDFVVCDPPYGINFMSKKFDNFKNQPAFSCEYWQEALRLCKPGSMLAAFGGDRTHHHLMYALEVSGWEIRTCCYWLFGSGFPKSFNIGKHVERFEGYGTALKPAAEIIVLAMKPLDGTFAQNAEKWGVAGINVDDSRIPSPAWSRPSRPNIRGGNYCNSEEEPIARNNDKGRWPANLILSEESAQELDKMTGVLKSGSGERRPNGGGKMFNGFSPIKADFPASSGGASRFFYCAKSSSSERNRGLEGMPLKENDSLHYATPRLNDLRMENEQKRNPKQNTHPTVKPISLMKYIITLLAPPGNPILLDPFAGSGSTLIAAKELGIEAIGIEKEPEYHEIATQRIKNWPVPQEQYELFK